MCRRGRRAACRAAGETGGLSVSVGWAFASRAPRPQAPAAGVSRPGAPRLDPSGAAPHRHDERADEFSGRRPEVWFCSGWQQRNLDQRTSPPHRQPDRPDLSCPFDAHRGDQSRPGDHLRPDRLAAARTALTGGVAVVRPGERGGESSRLRRPHLPRDRQGCQSGPPRTPLGGRVPAVEPPGGEAPQRRRPGPLPLRSTGHRSWAAADDARRAGGPQRPAEAGNRRSGDCHADCPVRDGFRDAGLRP